jgi:hypothetical protein
MSAPRFLVRPQRQASVDKAAPDLPMALVCECGDVLDLGPRPQLADIMRTAELHAWLRHPAEPDLLGDRCGPCSHGDCGECYGTTGPSGGDLCSCTHRQVQP